MNLPIAVVIKVKNYKDSPGARALSWHPVTLEPQDFLLVSTSLKENSRLVRSLVSRGAEPFVCGSVHTPGYESLTRIGKIEKAYSIKVFPETLQMIQEQNLAQLVFVSDVPELVGALFEAKSTENRQALRNQTPEKFFNPNPGP
jgi:hypothetical protein